MVLKNFDVRDVFPQKHGNVHVYPHENTTMARERDCVSSSYHHRAWKRVCVKNVFFLCLLKTKIRNGFSRSNSPEPLF